MALTSFLIMMPVFLLSTGPDNSIRQARAVDHELIGTVTDISSAPIPEVEVSVVKPAGAVRVVSTMRDGTFSISGIPEGSVLLRFRRLGYEAREVEVIVTNEKKTSVAVVLKPVPAELDSLTVRAEEHDALREFYDHKATRGSYAKFFTAEDIRKRGASYPSDMFRTIPGVTLAASTFSGSTVRIRGCQPMLWIDGQRIPNTEVDDVVSAGDIAGIEFYISLAGTPAQYMDRTTRACGSILVWTKNR